MQTLCVVTMTVVDILRRTHR